MCPLVFIVEARSWNMALGGLVLGSLILDLKGRRRMMFQLSGYYCRASSFWGSLFLKLSVFFVRGWQNPGFLNQVPTLGV